MPRTSRFCSPWARTLYVLCVAPLLLVVQTLCAAGPAARPAPATAATSLARLPLRFEPNRGQTDNRVQFVAHSPQATVYLSGADAVLQTVDMRKDSQGLAHVSQASAVRMHLAGAASSVTPIPQQPQSGTTNYMHGGDTSQWQTGLPGYGAVEMSNVYPGVSLKYHGRAGQLEYDFIVAAHADASAVKLHFEGTQAKLDKGSLVLPTGIGADLRFDQPIAYQTIAGKRVDVDVAFAMDAEHDVTFRLGSYDHARELTIDPTLLYLGTIGSGIHQIDLGQITVDSAGSMYFIGTTDDLGYPVTSGSYQTICGPTANRGGQVTYAGGYCPASGGGETSAFVTKLSADGTRLVYSTYLSGKSGLEAGGAITVDSSGVAYLLGRTGSDDFPVTADAFQKNCVAQYGVFGGPNNVPCDGYYNGGGTEYTIQNEMAYFSKLSADGTALLYSSFLGGTQPVYPNTIGLDASGSIYISGQVIVFSAKDLAPCVDGYQPHCQPNIQFPGITSSGYLTISGAKDSNGGSATINAAAFLSKFSNDGHTLLYGTFFGDNTSAINLLPTSMAVGVNGVAFLGGYTQAVNLPTTANAIKTACTQPGTNGNCNTFDGYVAAIDTTKSGAASLVWSTRLGGSTPTQGSNIPVNIVQGLTADSGNNAYATGYTFDHTFPMAKTGYQATCPNYDPADTFDRCDSAWVLKINPTGTAILGGSFLGGPNPRSAESVGYNVRLDSKGQVYLYGRSNDGGGDFPQVGALQAYKGGNQLFISTLSADMSKLIFSTRFGNPSYSDHSVTPAGGMVLDGNDNIYFAGTTTDTMFAGTAGTYNTQMTTGAGRHPFFAKLSKVLQPNTTTLTITPATISSGSAVTYKAVVVGTLQSTPVPTGTVTFSATNTTPATVLGTATLDGTGTATLKAAAPAAGTYTVVASYGADTNYNVSTSAAATLTVNSAAASTTVLTALPTTAGTGTTVTLKAIVSGAGGTPTGSVTFMDGSGTLGTVALSAGSATYTTTTLAAGTHTLTAVYSGDATFGKSTSTSTVVVRAPAATMTTVASSAASSSAGASVTFTATISSAAPSGSPTGMVTFYDGSASLGTGTVSGGSATLATSALAVGSHSITATYGGDGLFLGSTSSAFTQTVATASIALSVSPSTLTVSRGSSGTVSITATPSGAYSGTLTFSCSGLPTHAACLFSPTTLTFAQGTAAQTSTLTFTTKDGATALLRREGFGRDASSTYRVIAAVLFLPLGLLGFAARRSNNLLRARTGMWLLVLATSIGVGTIAGCGGSSSNNNSSTTASGAYTVQVVASVSGATVPVSLTVNVQ